MNKRAVMTFVEASTKAGVGTEKIALYIERQWISPCEKSGLDEEDVARIGLIEELTRDFGVNDESVPLILHLLDQLCFFREEVGRLKSGKRFT